MNPANVILKATLTMFALNPFFTLGYNNVDYIKKMNTNSKNGVVYDQNKFINETISSFDHQYKGLLSRDESTQTNCVEYEYSGTVNLPEQWDWREHGAVSSVKDQGQCGSCWSFSAVGSLEGAWAISTGQLYNLSEQQLMDCSRPYGNMACNGGLMDKAFEYAIDNGMCLYDDVPYHADRELCSKAVRSCNKVAYFNNCMKIPANNEKALKEAVFRGPVAVSIEADTKTFQFYKSGILDSSNCGTTLDHGVLAVGYGVEDGKKYWIVKNSWGSSWGENGYVRIAREDDENSEGVCGIAKDACLVTV